MQDNPYERPFQPIISFFLVDFDDHKAYISFLPANNMDNLLGNNSIVHTFPP